MDPARFADTAERLNRGGAGAIDESDARTAVGRAYYAVTITIRDHVCTRARMNLEKTQSHAFVAEWLKRFAKEPRMGKLPAAFGRLRIAREKADYEMAAPAENWSASTVAQRIDDAREVLQCFHEGIGRLPANVIEQSANQAVDEVRRRRTI